MDDKIVNKAGELIKPGAVVELIQPARYVSRGGEKLEGALKDFDLSPQNNICLDIGASTGGFTDCLLQYGAKVVYAVDVGTRQLDDSLRNDPRVRSIEQMHITEFKSDEKFEFITIDVSFISLKKVLPKVKELAAPGSKIVALVKPQFEVGAKFLKKGVVRDLDVQKGAVDDIIAFAKGLDFEYVAQAPSHLKGPKGNQEYFVYLRL